MFALYDSQRATLLRVAVMLTIGACATLPLTLPPSSVYANADSLAPTAGNLAVPQVPGRMQYPEIVIARDPFVADAGVLARNGVRPPLVASDSAPNGQAATNDERGAFLPVVRAVVSGDQPRALVEMNGSVQVLGIGDKLGADTVMSIDPSGIELSSGIRVGIAHP